MLVGQKPKKLYMDKILSTDNDGTLKPLYCPLLWQVSEKSEDTKGVIRNSKTMDTMVTRKRKKRQSTKHYIEN
jgi:hypothetical protein